MATIPWYILSTLLTIYLTCSFIEGLVTTIDIKVEGTDVLKSGVRQYSVYGHFQRSLTIKCLLNIEEEPKAVSLLNTQFRAENLTSSKRLTRLTFEWYKRILVKYSDEARTPDRYTCKAIFSLSTPSAVNGSDSYSEIYSEVEIKYVTSYQFTAFSVGLIAYTGEEVSIACKGGVEINGDHCSLQGQPSSAMINIPPANNSGQRNRVDYNCGYFRDGCHMQLSQCLCTLHINVEIWTKLELLLMPSNFSSNVTTLEFICTSIPPRLLVWTIITDNGDIIDLSSSSDIIKVSMNVTITQKPGATILNISEASAGGNGILSVICSSYDTTARVSESSHRVFIDECSDSDTDTILSTVSLPATESTIQTTTEIYNKKTTEIYKQKTTVDYDSFYTSEERLKEVPNVTEICVCQKPNFELCAESIEVRLLLLATIIFCSLVVAAVVLGLLRKLWHMFARATPTTFEEDDKVPSETVLHDNPVYLSFSETGGSSPVDVVQSDICAYANV